MYLTCKLFQTSKMTDCSKVMDPNNFLAGYFEMVTICPTLRKLLKIHNNTLPLSNLFVLLGNILKEDDVNGPQILDGHFNPEDKLTKQNVVQIIAQHAKFANPHFKITYINNEGFPTIRIDDLEPRPIIIEHTNDVQLPNMEACSVCVGVYTTDNIIKHKEKGPLAEGHSLANSTDVELHILLALNAYSFLENHAYCNFCETRFNLMHSVPTLICHAQLHAGYLLDSKISLADAKEQLFRNLKVKKPRVAVCMSCQRIFPNMKVLYLHLNLIEHTQDKNYCINCNTCLRTDTKEHIEIHHAEHAKCLYKCSIPGNLLAQHINAKHPNAVEIIPDPEMQMIAKKKWITWEDIIIGLYGTVRFNRAFIQNTNCLLTSPNIGSNIANALQYIDPLGWKIAKHAIDIERHNTDNRRRQGEYKGINEDYIPLIKENPCRFVSKVAMIKRQNSSELIEVHSTLDMFGVPKMHKQNNAFKQNSMRYTEDFINNYNIILMGNCHFRSLDNTDDTKMLNISTHTDSGWHFNALDDYTVNMNLEFDQFLRHNASRIAENCKLTIYIETSLTPILNEIPENQRANFLKNNISNLAFEIIRVAVNIQRKFRNVVITTSVHTLFSTCYTQELFYIRKFNLFIKTAALALNMGLLEFDQLGVYIHEHQKQVMFYKTDAKIDRPICDFHGTLTTYGKQKMTECIEKFEKEKQTFMTQILPIN